MIDLTGYGFKVEARSPQIEVGVVTADNFVKVVGGAFEKHIKASFKGIKFNFKAEAFEQHASGDPGAFCMAYSDGADLFGISFVIRASFMNPHFEVAADLYTDYSTSVVPGGHVDEHLQVAHVPVFVAHELNYVIDKIVAKAKDSAWRINKSLVEKLNACTESSSKDYRADLRRSIKLLQILRDK